MRELDKQARVAVIGTISVVLIVAAIVVGVLVKKYTPSSETMELTQYYDVAEEEALIIFKDGVYEKKALCSGDMPYIDYETVVERFDDHFYWDSNENLLLYTTPDKVIRTQAESSDYYENKSKIQVNYPIVKLQNGIVYIAVDYVKMFSGIEYSFEKEPNRVLIDYTWGKEYLYNTVKEATQVRCEPDIKSAILKEVEEKTKLVCMTEDGEVNEEFSKVMTEDGVIGYVRNKDLDKAFHETLESDFKKETYSHITKDYKINMVWHQIFNVSQNDNLLNQLSSTKGVTTIAPTWYRISSVEGEIDSVASEEYVSRAHNSGVEVWALVTDISEDGENVDMEQLLSWTSRRERLINELISNAIKLNLDGLNIDFEKITEKAGPHFIEFLRELSVKCRNNGIILSVDNYVPTEYTKQYNWKAEGEVVDYLVIMAYDEHYAGSDTAGPVASAPYVSNAISSTVSQVPKERVIIGIPFYTRIWYETNVGGDVELTSEAYSMQEAKNVVDSAGVLPEWDKEKKQYYAEYESSDGETVNKVWLEEDKSMEAKLKIIRKAGVAGISGWKLGLESDSVWDIIQKYNN